MGIIKKTEDLIGDDDKIIFKTNKNVMAIVKIAIFFFTFILAFLYYDYSFEWIQKIQREYFSNNILFTEILGLIILLKTSFIDLIVKTILFLFVVVFAIKFLLTLIKIHTTEYVITEKFALAKWGLGYYASMVPLTKIEFIDSEQRLFLGYGTIRMAVSKKAYEFSYVNDLYKFRTHIQKAIRKNNIL